MSEDIGVYVVLGALAILFALAISFQIYWAISTELTWASRVRRLLEHEGFTVKEMERRWLTRGPFTDMRLPGTRGHREWLIRLVAVDREQRPRAGWVRWRRAFPWQAADRWAVRWDDVTWTGEGLGGEGRKGLSSRAFLIPVMALGAAGAIAAVVWVLPNFTLRLPTRASQAVESSAYEVLCRGGGDGYRPTQLAWERRTERGVEVWRVLLSLELKASSQGAGKDAAGLAPGTCAWIDRPLNDQEPRVIRFEVPALLSADLQQVIGPLPGTFPGDGYMQEPAHFWSFLAFNTSQGHLKATQHGRWSPAVEKEGSS